MNTEKIVNQLKLDEGFSAESFWDDAPGGGKGQWTWGFGTKAPGPQRFITPEEAEKELYKAVQKSIIAFGVLFPDWASIPGLRNDVRQNALVNMIYNLGHTRFKEFKNTIAAIRKDDWAKVASHARQSLWFKQVGNRAKRICKELETGEVDA